MHVSAQKGRREAFLVIGGNICYAKKYKKVLTQKYVDNGIFHLFLLVTYPCKTMGTDIALVVVTVVSTLLERISTIFLFKV